LDSAARVEVRDAREIFIEYKHTGRLHSSELWAVMAHEIAHIFLHRMGIRFNDTQQNEILTDTTAIYLGFGIFFLNSQREEVTRIQPNSTERKITSIGYISADEMGYVLAQRDFVRNESSIEKITSSIGKSAYKDGKERFSQERMQRPYSVRSMQNQVLHRLGWMSAKERKGITFPCLICKQTIRIPSLYKTLDVTCPRCCMKLRCFS